MTVALALGSVDPRKLRGCEARWSLPRGGQELGSEELRRSLAFRCVGWRIDSWSGSEFPFLGREVPRVGPVPGVCERQGLGRPILSVCIYPFALSDAAETVNSAFSSGANRSHGGHSLLWGHQELLGAVWCVSRGKDPRRRLSRRAVQAPYTSPIPRSLSQSRTYKVRVVLLLRRCFPYRRSGVGFLKIRRCVFANLWPEFEHGLLSEQPQ